VAAAVVVSLRDVVAVTEAQATGGAAGVEEVEGRQETVRGALGGHRWFLSAKTDGKR
jgi:hypothetical protein